MKVIENNLFQLLVDLLLLPKDDIPLTLNSRAIKLRVLKDITNNINRLSHIFPEALRIINGLFPRGVGIQMGAKVLNLQLESVLASFIRTLESHMLKEMSSTIRLVSLRS